MTKGGHKPTGGSRDGPGARGPDPLRLERRCGERRATTGWVTATFRDDLGRVGVTGGAVVDSSPEGLGLRCLAAIEPGMSVVLRDGGREPFWHDAVAVRCTQDGAGYLVGLRLPRRAAA
jgi:hypothetical protein